MLRLAEQSMDKTPTPSVRDADKSKPYIPLAGLANDGWSKDEEATATCYCGNVQLAFVSSSLTRNPWATRSPSHLAPRPNQTASPPAKCTDAFQPTTGPGFQGSFVCNCADCRKITASMFSSIFTIKNEYLRHLRGQFNLKTFSQSKTIASHAIMTNYFCGTCGSLMYRVPDRFPEISVLRLGTVDDFNLVETKLKPKMEVFIKDRVSWFTGVMGDGVERFDASPA